jgi:hypothetical protein
VTIAREGDYEDLDKELFYLKLKDIAACAGIQDADVLDPNTDPIHISIKNSMLYFSSIEKDDQGARKIALEQLEKSKVQAYKRIVVAKNKTTAKHFLSKNWKESDIQDLNESSLIKDGNVYSYATRTFVVIAECELLITMLKFRGGSYLKAAINIRKTWTHC